MPLFRVDETKHPHPRRYRRALGWLIAGVIFGLALTVFGIAMAPGGYTGARAWLVAATIIGPSIIFLAAVGYATYLEGLEATKYGGVYEEETPPAQTAEGFRQVP